MSRPASLVETSLRDDWRTPQSLLAVVRAAFCGPIDLDPCGQPDNPTGAKHVYVLPDQDGLELPWRGNVFVNPPYGRAIAQWAAKAVHESKISPCSVNAARILMLLPARVDAGWWHALWPHLTHVCFLRGRVAFDPPPGYAGPRNGAKFPSALVALSALPGWHTATQCLGIQTRPPGLFC